MSRRKVGCIDGKGRGVCLEEDRPDPGAGQVRVAVQASLISPGTELGRVKKQRERVRDDSSAVDSPPRPFGYANAGIVEAVGEGGETFRVGDRLACMGGGYALHTDCACVPQNLCAALPDSVDFESGAFAHLAATAVHAIRRAQPQFGENGMVMGLGLVGNLSSQFGQLSGCHMMGVDRLPLRLELAARTGTEAVVDGSSVDPVPEAELFAGGYGMDFGVIAFGGDGTEAVEQIAASLKRAPDTHRMGRVVIVGGAQITHGFAAALGNIDVRSAARTGPGYHDEAYEHGAGYPPVFVEWPTQRNLSECLRAIAASRLQVAPLITPRFPLEQVGEAVDLLVETPERALGVILKPS